MGKTAADEFLEEILVTKASMPTLHIFVRELLAAARREARAAALQEAIDILKNSSVVNLGRDHFVGLVRALAEKASKP